MPCLIRSLKLSAVHLSLLLVIGCSDQKLSSALPPAAGKNAMTMEVYKSKSCECCVDWIEHLKGEGMAAKVHHPQDLDKVKSEHGIAPRFQSCHTGISEDGYVFEGHVPARYIKQFIENPPADGIGLAVPGMPVGSPGMEIGDRFSPYAVLLLKKDGSSEVYAQVRSPRDQ